MVRFNPAPRPNQRPCDVVEAVTYEGDSGYVIMLCDKDYKGVNQEATFSRYNTRNVKDKSVDILGKTISSDLMHELIHAGGNMVECEYCSASLPVYHLRLIF